ncbi:hypothetical protein Mal15_34500 [Stieleria maiorica]|uniref:Uncharacterized protein n=1 Tax=Stieleria maiorica TaxID=2795974 RepID=A0A5B9MGY4_9BACT|nr:hypothetical protein [Stieleria maiorica]QEF99386.1 hypothetical protein Mal15_34500 [Stieleria maiorica]
MVRLSFVLVALLSVDCSLANGQWFGNQSRGLRRSRAQSHAAPTVPNRYRTPYPTSTRAMSIGVFSYPDYNHPRPGSFDPYRFDNYVYDPYRFGSFEAPDLLNDPYFRERHRYDSHFPGRRRPPLVMKTPQPEFAYPSPRNPYLYKGSKEALRNPSSKHPQTANAPQQLIASLSAMDDGEAWMEFLAPDRVDDLIAEGDQAELKELLSHYDGIVNSPALKAIAAARGFQATRELLRRHVQAAEELPPAPGDAIQWETLPPAQI